MWPESSVGQAAQPEGLPGEDPNDCHPNAQTYPRQRRPVARERQKSGHTESAKLCCGSHLAAELKLQGSRGTATMRYAKRILVAAAIFSSYSAALAFDKKEIGSTLHHADSSGGSSSKKSTDNGAPTAKPNAPTASDSGASGSSTLSSNKDITITNSVGMNITFHGSAHGSAPLTIKIGRRPHC